MCETENMLRIGVVKVTWTNGNWIVRRNPISRPHSPNLTRTQKFQFQDSLAILSSSSTQLNYFGAFCVTKIQQRWESHSSFLFFFFFFLRFLLLPPTTAFSTSSTNSPTINNALSPFSKLMTTAVKSPFSPVSTFL